MDPMTKRKTLNIFVRGLKTELQGTVHMIQPKTLYDTVGYWASEPKYLNSDPGSRPTLFEVKESC